MPVMMEPETIKAFELSGSVGAGGKNDKWDIMTVQLMLNNIIPEYGGATPRLQEDGAKFGPNWSRTVEAIRIFQDEQFKWKDGRVDPEGQTHQKMRKLLLNKGKKNPDLTITEVRPADGMDDTLSPKWQMVPEGGFKRIKVKNLKPGAEVRILDRDVATVESITGDVVLIRGGRPGSTRLTVRGSVDAEFVTTLDIGVKRYREFPVYFNYVRNNLGQGSKYRRGAANEFLMGLNNIFLPQANIRIVSRGEREISKINGKAVNFNQRYFVLDNNLGGIPDSFQIFRWADLIADSQGGPKACNIFYVKEFEDDNDPHTRLFGEARGIGTGPLVVEDNPGLNRFQTLAHELAHVMGCDHDSDRHSLICDGNNAAENGTRIRKAAVETMHRHHNLS